MSIIDDEGSNSSDNEHFQDIVNASLSRRGSLTGVLPRQQLCRWAASKRC